MGPPGDTLPSLSPYLKEIRERCTECGACTKNCAFLSHYGTPKAIATGFDFSSPRHQAIAYECSLCSLCSAACPEKLDPFRLFLEVRRQYVDGGHFDESAYGVIWATRNAAPRRCLPGMGCPRAAIRFSSQDAAFRGPDRR